MLGAPRRFPLVGHAGAVNACGVSPVDAALLVTGGEDRTARVWRVDCNGSASCIAVLTSCSDAVSAVCFHATIPSIVYVSAGTRVHEFEFDVEAGSNTPSYVPRSTMMFSSDEVGSIACTDRLIVTGDDDGALCFIDGRTRKLLRIERAAHTSVCGALALASHGPRVAVSGGFDHTLAIWSMEPSMAAGCGMPHVRVAGLASAVDFSALYVDQRREALSNAKARGRKPPAAVAARRSATKERVGTFAGSSSSPASSTPQSAVAVSTAETTGVAREGAGSTSAQARDAVPADAISEADVPSGGVGTGSSSGRFLNPPFVNAIALAPVNASYAIPDDAGSAAPCFDAAQSMAVAAVSGIVVAASTGVEQCVSACDAVPRESRMAVALGDGQVVLLRISEQQQQQRDAGVDCALTAASDAVGVGARRGSGRAPKASVAQGAPALVSPPSLVAPPAVQLQSIVVSREAAFDAHSAAATVVGYMPWRGASTLLYTAGNDGLVRVWDIGSALVPAPPRIVWQSARTRSGANAVCCTAPAADAGMLLLVAGIKGASIYWWPMQHLHEPSDARPSGSS